MFKDSSVTLKGLAPLLMHNGRLNDKRDPFAIELSRCIKLGKKSEDMALRSEDVEWAGGLYHTGSATIQEGVVTFAANARVIVPADNLWACTVEGATVCRMGKAMQSALIIEDDPVLNYDGPKDLNKLLLSPAHKSRKRVGIKGSGVMRTRPMFRSWAITFVAAIEVEQIDPDALRAALSDAGARKGLGDWTPRYGRFELSEMKEA